MHTPLRELRERKDVRLLSLEDLLRLLGRRQRGITQVSLELKFPEHPQWPEQLARLYAQLAASGIAHKARRPAPVRRRPRAEPRARARAQIALVVDNGAQAAQHRSAQRQHGVTVELLQLHRDLDAPVGPDGQPHFNQSLALATGALFDGWSVSVKLLEPAMMAQARRLQRPVSVWVVDDEEALELAWRLEVDGLVTNRPKWAHSQVLAWYDEACAREGAAPRQELRTR